MQFDIYFNNKICGNLFTYQDGLYQIFEVDADIVNLNICRVFLKNQDFTISLGVLMPKNNRYILFKKLPCSSFKQNGLNQNFSAYIECDVKTPYVNDENLAKIVDKLQKQTFSNYDLYFFEYNQEFLFDFCFVFCEIKKFNNKIYITLKTDKNGNIIV